jgi:transposase
MAQHFIGCDREQAYLMPPSLRDWVAEDHLVWTVLGAVEEMDLSAFYGAYRADGHGRPAYEPSMMVGLLLYAYAMGNRSSRGIERECQEDVAYRVITANLVPDHSTVAEFRKRHEAALAELFGEVLVLCREAGLVEVGVIAVDGTKVHANASNHSNREYRQIAREILAEADRIDREEDERYGEARGDELPERLRTAEGRRTALREAKRKLERQRAGRQAAAGPEDSAESRGTVVELDPAQIVGRVQGRRGWLREARHQLDEQRRLEARPVPRSRCERLLESERRLSEELTFQRAANEAYEAYRARGVMKDGRRFGGPPKPYVPPEEPDGKVNITDPDSRNLKGFRGYVQGYNAQAVVTENQIVIAAEVNSDSPDFGHLEPMIAAAQAELARAGVTDKLDVALADSGYWHHQQMDKLASDGVQVLIPPDASKRTGTRPGWDGGRYSWMRHVLAGEAGRRLYRRRSPMIEPVFAQIKFNRKIDRFQRRGRSAVRSEWRLAAMTHNLLKLHNHQTAASSA